MSVRNLRRSFGESQAQFAERYRIPYRTLQNWEAGINTPPAYVEEMLRQKVQTDLINHRQYKLPEWSENKKPLPLLDQFAEPSDWLSAVQEKLGKNVVFALDSALMCDGSYLGRMGEWIVWIYGDPKLSKYNGVCVIGQTVDAHDVEQKNGLSYTCFPRTLNDALANRDILDMQGITEALSRYYFSHHESYDGLHPSPEYSPLFCQLAEDAASYYSD